MLLEVNTTNPLDPAHLGNVINHVSQSDQPTLTQWLGSRGRHVTVSQKGVQVSEVFCLWVCASWGGEMQNQATGGFRKSLILLMLQIAGAISVNKLIVVMSSQLFACEMLYGSCSQVETLKAIEESVEELKESKAYVEVESLKGI